MTPTPEQAAIIAAARDTSDNLIVEALAGTGKTSTLRAVRQVLRGTVLALAFNKSAQLELEERFSQDDGPPTVCKTLNGLGHGVFAQHTNRRLKLNTRKLWDLYKKLSPDIEFRDFASALGAARRAGIVPSGFAWPSIKMASDSQESWEDILDAADVNFEPAHVPMLRRALRESCLLAAHGEIDFDDQLYMPTVYRAQFPAYDNILVDEAQDLSPIQHKMIEACARKGRIIAVGDRNQAIYGFRGALANSMDALKETFQCRELPLSVCWRCPESVVELARRQRTPTMQARPGAPEGRVLEWPKPDFDFMRQHPGAVVCRNNAPLFSLAYKLLANGIGCRVVGGDIGKAMKATLNKITKGQNPKCPVERVATLIEQWRSAETERGRQKQASYIIARASDRAESFHAIIKGSGAQTLTELLLAVDDLFSDKAALLDLCSIHKAKGLEWPNVYHLEPGRIPSPYATTAEEYTQERNLLYVATTRATDTLVMIEDLS